MANMPDVRFLPEFTRCTQHHGQLPQVGARGPRGNITRHSMYIMDLGKCRICGETRLYAGRREKMLEELSTALLKMYVTEVDEAVWGIDDVLWAEVNNLGEEELPEELDEDDDVDYDAEGLRIIREALMRAAGKIEAHLNSAGEDL